MLCDIYFLEFSVADYIFVGFHSFWWKFIRSSCKENLQGLYQSSNYLNDQVLICIFEHKYFLLFKLYFDNSVI